MGTGATAGLANNVAPTKVMGILNVTPDSFSDGGWAQGIESQVELGVAMHVAGADLVDVGGVSTRPGADPVSAEVELERVIEVIKILAANNVKVSVDTMRASTAVAAVEAGASMVNDVSGGLADPEMASAIADLNVEYVAMHWRGHSGVMDKLDVYDAVVTEVRDELAARVDALTSAGIDADKIILDPGLGFAKVGSSNWPLIADIDAWNPDGHRVLIGASRKRFLGAVIERKGHGASPHDREHATTAVTALVAAQGAWAVRVHDVPNALDAIRVVEATRNA